VSVVMQWLHVLGAVLAVGGVAFARLVLIPSAEGLDEEAREALMEGIHKRFRQVVALSIGLLLITGLYNVGIAAVAGSFSVSGYLYPMIFKLVLALVVFKIAFMLIVPGPAFSGVKAKRKTWLMVNLVLGAVVILLGAYLRRMSL